MNARTAISIATLLVVACLWYLFTSATGWVGSARFPNPAEFGQAVRQIALTGYADARIHQHVQHWRSLEPALLPRTGLLLRGLRDMRIPLSLTQNECAVIGGIVRVAVARAAP